MPNQPAAEIVVEEPLVRRLIESQARSIPGITSLPITFAAEGWDCTVWRLGAHLAIRLPRRSLAAPLIEPEHRYLPELASRLRSTGVGIPAPVFAGTPSSSFPWSWSIVPWFDGDAGLTVPRHRRSSWAQPLAAALRALHVSAGEDFPVNPFRGVPLSTRACTVAERLAGLRARSTEGADALALLWDRGVTAPPWRGPAIWIHGDLHPGNTVARQGKLIALIDFGDLTAGDPAYDLAIAWLAFDSGGRDRFRAALRGHYDDATWTRAHAWAAAVTLMLLEHSDDNAPYGALGRECLSELTA